MSPWVLGLAVFCTAQGALLAWAWSAMRSRSASRRLEASLRTLRTTADRADVIALNAAIFAAQAGAEARGIEAVATGVKELAATLREAAREGEVKET